MAHREIKSKISGKICEATRRVLDREPSLIYLKFYLDKRLINQRGLSRWIKDRVVQELIEMFPDLRKYKPEDINNTVTEHAILRGVMNYSKHIREDDRTSQIKDILRQIKVNYQEGHWKIEVKDKEYISSPELLRVLFDVGAKPSNISMMPEGYIIDIEGNRIGKALDYIKFYSEST